MPVSSGRVLIAVINYVSLCFKKSVTMSLFTQIALEIIFIN